MVCASSRISFAFVLEFELTFAFFPKGLRSYFAIVKNRLLIGHSLLSVSSILLLGVYLWFFQPSLSFLLPEHFLWGGLTVVLFVVLSYLSGKIDLAGSLAGGLIAMGIFLGGGFWALGLLLVFFVLGTLASVWKRKDKETLGLAQENKGKRGAKNAFSNGGVAGICGFLAFLFPQDAPLFLTALATSLATATGDTLSSELGNVYGSRYFDILTLKRGTRGEDGVISGEGTLLGLAGSAIIGLSYWLVTEGEAAVGIIIMGGLLGNLLDSLYGASLQRQGWLTNDSVNYLATASGAVLGALLA
jgi:uncharacterized protein (TIGR00297 family)